MGSQVVAKKKRVLLIEGPLHPHVHVAAPPALRLAEGVLGPLPRIRVLAQRHVIVRVGVEKAIASADQSVPYVWCQRSNSDLDVNDVFRAESRHRRGANV